MEMFWIVNLDFSLHVTVKSLLRSVCQWCSWLIDWMFMFSWVLLITFDTHYFYHGSCRPEILNVGWWISVVLTVTDKMSFHSGMLSSLSFMLLLSKFKKHRMFLYDFMMSIFADFLERAKLGAIYPVFLHFLWIP